jgi:hypothetical protein
MPLVSSRGEFRPPALVEPCVNLSIHTAPITRSLRLDELPVGEQSWFESCDQN